VREKGAKTAAPFFYNELAGDAKAGGKAKMDPLTHTATGLFLSRAGLNRWTPRATPILLLAANAPDIDIVALAGGSLSYLRWHRHITHSLIAAPVLALITVAVVKLAGRKAIRWPGAVAAALVAVGSHLLLDWTNTYGVRMLEPFSERWLNLDLAPLFDPWIWAVALLAILGPIVARLVGSEISSGTVKPRHHGRGFAWFALVFVLVYMYGRSIMHQRALATLDARVYQGVAPLRVAAFPAPNPWQWHGMVETADFVAMADVDLTAEFDPAGATVFHKPDPDPAIEAARATPTFQEFLRFSQYPLWRVSPAPDMENAKLVEVVDMRFGSPLNPGFMASAVVDSRLRVVREDYTWGLRRR
jgi:inner membrane protein